MNNITISVIIPTYNSSLFIEKTLASVLEQTYMPDELVIVDDGSTDDTIDKVNKFKFTNKDKIKNIKIIRQENKGAGAARNKAIKEATGEWIAFLDSDDIWLPTKMKAVKSVIEDNSSVGIIAHDEFFADENDLNCKRLCALHEKYDQTKDLFIQLFEGNLFSTSCMVIRKDIIQKAGGFDETLRSAQDYDCWIRCALHGLLYFIPEPYEIYVTRKGNITANTYRRYKCELKICQKYVGILKMNVGLPMASFIVLKRVFNIHKIETYLAISKKQWRAACKISTNLFPELLKNLFILYRS